MMKSIFILFLFNPVFAHAFPEMIRFHYVNCTSCHVSPNGGGLLNDYGRETSVAALSTFGTEDESKPFYNLFNKPSNLDVGAYIRGVQTASSNDLVSSGYYWWMEADLEAAYHFGENKRWTIDFSLGVSPDVLNGLLPKNTSPFSSRRQYVLYQLTDGGMNKKRDESSDSSARVPSGDLFSGESFLRAGKFVPTYGIYFPDHTISTRQGIGFDEGDETYNLEYTFQNETQSFSITADLGRPDDQSLRFEKGGAGTFSYNLSDHDKVGMSGYFGAQNGNSRQLTGPFLLMGLSEKLYFSAEADLEWSEKSDLINTHGLFTYAKLGWVIFQGFEVYFMEQSFTHAFNGIFEPTPEDLRYGLVTNRLFGMGPGVYWFPRPHFYFQIEAEEQISPELPSNQLSAFLTGNFYF